MPRYTLPLIIFIGLLLGFVLPQVGLIFKPMLSYFLMALMFFVCLKIDISDFKKVSLKEALIALFLMMVFAPLLALGGKFFAPIVFTGMLLALSCPSANASTFFSGEFGGDSSLAIILTTITGLISLVTLPLTMLIGVGSSITFDAVPMVLNLVQIILLPMIAALLLRKYSKAASTRTLKYDRLVSYVSLIFIFWGGVASGASFIQSNLYEFLSINVVLTLLLSVAILVPFSLSKFFGRKVAITMAVTTSMKNGILALVIGSATFGAAIVPVLVANLIDQNLLLIALGLILKRKN
jgi:bile acid:Na+ symporter, BASS family